MKMNDAEILGEAMYLAESVAEELASIHLPTRIIEQCKEGKLPQDIWQAKHDLEYASSSLTRLVIKIDKWKDGLRGVKRADILYERHILSLIEAIREIRTDIDMTRRFIRDKTRTPLRDTRPDYLRRDGE